MTGGTLFSEEGLESLETPFKTKSCVCGENLSPNEKRKAKSADTPKRGEKGGLSYERLRYAVDFPAWTDADEGRGKGKGN